MLYGALNFDTDKIFTTPNVTEQAYFINLIVSNDIDAVFRKVGLIGVISSNNLLNFKCRKFNRLFGQILYNSNALLSLKMIYNARRPKIFVGQIWYKRIDPPKTASFVNGSGMTHNGMTLFKSKILVSS